MTATVTEDVVTTEQAALESARSALSELLRHEARVIEGVEEAEAELAQLRESMGERVLDDPEALAEISEALGVASGQLEALGAARKALAPRIQRARREVLLAEADVLAVERAEAEAKLAAHQAKTKKLLHALFRHEGEGEFLRVGQLDFELRVAGEPSADGESRVFTNERAKPWASDPLRARVAELELREGVLRAVAADEDPSDVFKEHPANPSNPGTILLPGGQRDVYEFYPPSVRGPEAVIAAPAYNAYRLFG